MRRIDREDVLRKMDALYGEMVDLENRPDRTWQDEQVALIRWRTVLEKLGQQIEAS